MAVWECKPVGAGRKGADCASTSLATKNFNKQKCVKKHKNSNTAVKHFLKGLFWGITLGGEFDISSDIVYFTACQSWAVPFLCLSTALYLCSPAQKNATYFTSYQITSVANRDHTSPCKGLHRPPQAIIGGCLIRWDVQKTLPSIAYWLRVYMHSSRQTWWVNQGSPLYLHCFSHKEKYKLYSCGVFFIQS